MEHTQGKPQYRPWPKRKDSISGKRVIDKDKVRELYLANPLYSFKAFAEANRFKFYPTNGTFPYQRWQREWVEQQVAQQDDAITPQIMATRQDMLFSRVRHIQNWNQTAANMATIHTYLIQKLGRQMQHDEANAARIARGEVAPQFNLKPGAWLALVAAGKTLHELERSALLVPPQAMAQTLIPVKERTPEEKEADAEAQELETIPIEVMGSNQVPQEQLTEMLGKWYDQAQGGYQIDAQPVGEPTPAPQESDGDDQEES